MLLSSRQILVSVFSCSLCLDNNGPSILPQFVIFGKAYYCLEFFLALVSVCYLPHMENIEKSNLSRSNCLARVVFRLRFYDFAFIKVFTPFLAFHKRCQNVERKFGTSIRSILLRNVESIYSEYCPVMWKKFTLNIALNVESVYSQY